LLHEGWRQVAPNALRFRAFGTPITQGSMNAMFRGGRTVVWHKRSNELYAWRNDIAEAAVIAMHLAGWEMVRSSHVKLDLRFLFRRPPSHLAKDGTVRAGYVRVLPGSDLDKLCRAALDALTGTLYDDDKRVVELAASKGWTNGEPGLIAIVADFWTDDP